MGWDKKGAPLRGAPLGGAGWIKALLLGLRVRLRGRVVLFAIDVTRRVVLLLVDLLLFTCRQCATVGLAIGCYLLVDRFLLLFELGCFGRRELAALDALRDPSLLIFTPLTNFVVTVMRDGWFLCGLRGRRCCGRGTLR